MRSPLSKKIINIQPSGIRRFFDVANEMKDAISLGVGEPDFDTPWRIRDEGIFSLEKGRTFYTSNAGLKELRQEICRYLERKIHVSYDPMKETLVTAGGSEAIDVGLRCMLDPGDEVIIPQPSYVSYLPCTVMADGVPVTVPLKYENEFKLTVEDLEEYTTPKTKILIMPFPNNPTGSIMTREDLEPVAEFVKEHDLYVISDEIYSELTYQTEHVSIASLPGMRERTGRDQRIFQRFCHDGMAARLLLRPGGDHRADDKAPSVRYHVCAHDEPVCGGRGFKELRR